MTVFLDASWLDRLRSVRRRNDRCVICKTERVAPNHYVGRDCLKALPSSQRFDLLRLPSHGARLKLALKIARLTRMN